MDSLTDEDLEKRNSAPDLQVKMPNTARVGSTLSKYFRLDMKIYNL